MRIAVTGASGKAGRAVVSDLTEHGYEVRPIDIARPPGGAPYLHADLADLGQALEALKGTEAVVHLAAIPAPGLQTDEVTFRTNVMSTYNVFTAASAIGLGRIVWASSETTLGVPFARRPPAYAPIDEDHPCQPESSYALSKVVGEEMAKTVNEWSGLPVIGLRFSNIMEPADYDRFPSFWGDATLRCWNLWGYVDARDVALSCRLALERDISGSPIFIIAAADTVMERPSRELVAEVYPEVPLRAPVDGTATLLSIDRARRELGYEPGHSWRDHLRADRVGGQPLSSGG